MLCHPLQQQLQSSICDNWQWVFHITVEEFWPTLLYRVVLILPHWKVFKHEWTDYGHAQVFRENKRKHHDQTVCHQPALKPVLTSWPPSSQSSSNNWSCTKSPHASNAPPSWIQSCGSNVCGHEIIWKTGFGLSEGLHWTLTGPPVVCLQSKQVCGGCSQHGTALHPAASGQTRDLCEDPVCRLQLHF